MTMARPVRAKVSGERLEAEMAGMIGEGGRPRGASRPAPPEVLSVARQVAAIVRRVTGDPAYRVFLFGSWASGKARQRSDIDIGIEGTARVSPAAMLEIREACEALSTLYTIEVVDFAQVAPEFYRAATTGRLDVEPV